MVLIVTDNLLLYDETKGENSYHEIIEPRWKHTDPVKEVEINPEDYGFDGIIYL